MGLRHRLSCAVQEDLGARLVTAGHREIPRPAWGSKDGFCSVGGPQPCDAGAIIDRVLIAETVYRYAWAFDEHDRHLLAACFWPDGRFVGSFMGTEDVGPFEGRDAIVDWLGGAMDLQLHQRRHHVTNLVVDALTSTTATAGAFLHMTAVVDQEILAITAGFYRVAMEKDRDVWRIREMFAGFDRPFYMPDEVERAQHIEETRLT